MEKCDRAMKSDETVIYRRIISEQIDLQELQHANGAKPNSPVLARKIKQQRRLLSELWQTADSLKRLTPLT